MYLATKNELCIGKTVSKCFFESCNIQAHFLGKWNLPCFETTFAYIQFLCHNSLAFYCIVLAQTYLVRWSQPLNCFLSKPLFLIPEGVQFIFTLIYIFFRVYNHCNSPKKSKIESIVPVYFFQSSCVHLPEYVQNLHQRI